TQNCAPKCPSGSGTQANPCWRVAIHGDQGTLDLINQFMGDSRGHGTMGYPAMDGWPAWDIITAQQAYYEWLQRAHDHGLKFMTMHAVNNALLCNLVPRKVSYGCDDDSAVLRQIHGAKALEQYIDAKAGGPAQGFYRIVYSGDEAREAIADGKLAVMLGVEVDTPWGCTVNASFCTPDYIRQKVQEMYDLGV